MKWRNARVALNMQNQLSFNMGNFTFRIYLLIFCASHLTLTICQHNLDSPNEPMALFIFGDSMSYAGKNNYINTTADSQENYLPYGTTFFNYPTGRLSDGRLIPDFIGEILHQMCYQLCIHSLIDC